MIIVLVMSIMLIDKEVKIFAKYLKELGCKTAFNLDGGGSVKLYYKPKGTNDITTLHSTSRKSSTIMYFTELS